MILVDTSVWIDLFLAKSNTPHVQALKRMILNRESPAAICGLVLGEVLQGIRIESEYRKVRALFDSLPYLEASRETHIAAVDMYRSLRQRGITIRSLPDCLIARTAIEHKVSLLHFDRDFEPIRLHFGLMTHNASWSS